MEPILHPQSGSEGVSPRTKRVVREWSAGIMDALLWLN